MGTRASLPPSVQGRRERRKHVTRRELLAAGRRLFAERGLYESRIEDLSRRAGIAKGTLYGYFANKQELIEAVVRSGFHELLERVQRAAQEARTRPEAIERVTEAHLAFFRDNPDLMRVFHQVRGLLKFDRPGPRPLRRVLGRYLDGLAQVLALRRSGRRAAGVRDLDLAILLFGTVSGVTSVHASVDGRALTRIESRAARRAIVRMVQSLDER
ncbi:MAG TPA: helix-turn-helix domain-containing protein [Candidatus Sulfotelmatobacter sp.]|nr:helix-turn-helix domain-containing protein [Candidatus Sulfotelmatobacter sp.]